MLQQVFTEFNRSIFVNIAKTSLLLVGVVCLLAYGLNSGRVPFVGVQKQPQEQAGSQDAFETAQRDIQETFEQLNERLTTPPPRPEQVVKAAFPAPSDPAELLVAEIDAPAAEQAWRDWMVRHDIKHSAIAIGKAGQIIHSAGQRRSADAPYPLASLSKAITAMCLHDLLADTPYTWNTTLGELTTELSAINMAPNPNITDLTLAELATHTSGFPKNIVKNNRKTSGRDLYTQQHFARTALSKPDLIKHRGKHRYSNVNYAVLGQVIMALSDNSYAEECKPRVLTPAGATGATLSGYMWATGSFGGWAVSAEDYARFVMHWYGADRPWMIAPQAFPFDKRSAAGLGVFHTTKAKISHIRHAGKWASKTPERQHGSLFQLDATGAVFVVHWQGQPPKGALRDLRHAITPHLR